MATPSSGEDHWDQSAEPAPLDALPPLTLRAAVKEQRRVQMEQRAHLGEVTTSAAKTVRGFVPDTFVPQGKARHAAKRCWDCCLDTGGCFLDGCEFGWNVFKLGATVAFAAVVWYSVFFGMNVIDRALTR